MSSFLWISAFIWNPKQPQSHKWAFCTLGTQKGLWVLGSPNHFGQSARGAHWRLLLVAIDQVHCLSWKKQRAALKGKWKWGTFFCFLQGHCFWFESGSLVTWPTRSRISLWSAHFENSKSKWRHWSHGVVLKESLLQLRLTSDSESSSRHESMAILGSWLNSKTLWGLGKKFKSFRSSSFELNCPVGLTRTTSWFIRTPPPLGKGAACGKCLLTPLLSGVFSFFSISGGLWDSFVPRVFSQID